ncbi:uncharacterized protein LOC131239312 [Magnolia sinica]|nr:uncharacterized protein LOC131239312 [Magnolia sinica]
MSLSSRNSSSLESPLSCCSAYTLSPVYNIFMSILPTDVQRSSPLIPSLSQSPSSDHGLFRPLQSPNSPIVSDTDAAPAAIVGSPQIFPSESLSIGNSSSMAASSTDPCGFSKKVTNVRTQDGKKGSYGHNHGSTSLRNRSAGRGGLSSQFRSDHSRSSQRNGKQSGAVSSSHVDQPATGPISPQSSTAHSMARKNQMMNGNHLLNFHYDPISRPQPRIPPPRKPRKVRPYNKDLFLQANFKFVVLDSGNYATGSMDPDKMLQWEDVVCVRYSTPFSVQCPICLESPLCSQITSCGHIFCFPCILRYLLMGEEDRKGDCWKKCPLCFMMISSKDLYTIYIDHVKQYCVGDHINFTLLTRPKDSLIPSQKDHQETSSIPYSSDGPSQKDHQETGSIPYSSDGLCDAFSKFHLTSDVELSMREAIMELNDWLAKAESGLVEDLEQLPYVCAALEQFEQRKKCWAEHQTISGSPPLRNCTNSVLKVCKYNCSKTESHANADEAYSEACESAPDTSCTGCKDEASGNSLSMEKLGGDDCVVLLVDLPESFEGPEKLSSSYDEDRSFRRHSNGCKDVREKDLYTFYQAVDGQHLILHPLNMKCLLHRYGSHDLLPSRIGGEILQLETVTQSEAMRRRYRFLSHFSLTTTFQLCEIDLSDILPPDALSPFMDEIKKREKQRKRVAKKENEGKARAEAAALQARLIPHEFRHSYNDATFSIDDFEALGSSSVVTSSTSPPVLGERKLFSDVTRLGFAAAYDSPSLKAEEPVVDASSSMEASGGPSSLIGSRSTVATPSFANIISTLPSAGGPEAAKMNGFGKKGKKPSRVLLSTAGGRRY